MLSEDTLNRNFKTHRLFIALLSVDKNMKARCLLCIQKKKSVGL